MTLPEVSCLCAATISSQLSVSESVFAECMQHACIKTHTASSDEYCALSTEKTSRQGMSLGLCQCSAHVT